ncbi:MAG: RebB family R body protein [Bacteroidota bacterium]
MGKKNKKKKSKLKSGDTGTMSPQTANGMQYQTSAHSTGLMFENAVLSQRNTFQAGFAASVKDVHAMLKVHKHPFRGVENLISFIENEE